MDLARRDFVFDIARLEVFCATVPNTNGFAILLTNDAALWSLPASSSVTRDREFRLHEGRTLSGTLQWADGTYPENARTLLGTYPIEWQLYSQLAGPGGDFRWLIVEVAP